MSQKLYTRKGDDGFTGLLGEGRVLKSDARMEALGSIDEASAALGLARSLVEEKGLQELILQVQRGLYQIMAEVAATPENSSRFRTIGQEQVNWLEEHTDRLAEGLRMPAEFIVPGDSPASAAFSMARSVVRRAERRVVELAEKQLVENASLLAYLNRLSSLCFVLEVREAVLSRGQEPTLARKKKG